MSNVNKYLVDGLDFLGKSSLVTGIQHKRGFHQAIHFSKPQILEAYKPVLSNLPGDVVKREMLYQYQRGSFLNLFEILRSPNAKIICDRAHLGEAVYSNLYRGYDGAYVFDLEKDMGMSENVRTRLILLTEDFSCSMHFKDDGLSFDVSKREQEQDLFLAAFEKSIIRDKRIVCVTDPSTGGFKSKDVILAEVLNG